MTAMTWGKSFRLLTKPGIILGNAITATGGFALASNASFDFWLLLLTITGLSLVIASAGVFNNYIDRESDEKMVRTKMRSLAFHRIPHRRAIALGVLLILLGTVLLTIFVSSLTALIALFGFFVYILLYSFSKYRTIHATLIGSIAGSVPPLVGYSATGNVMDLGAWLLFMAIALWQMPHFFAIAIYRMEDYAKAGIPVFPIVKGTRTAKIHMFFYILAFVAISSMLTVFHYTGDSYLIATLLLGTGWLLLSIKGFRCDNDQRWARQMFFFSLIVVTGLSIVMLLP